MGLGSAQWTTERDNEPRAPAMVAYHGQVTLVHASKANWLHLGGANHIYFLLRDTTLLTHPTVAYRTVKAQTMTPWETVEGRRRPENRSPGHVRESG